MSYANQTFTPERRGSLSAPFNHSASHDPRMAGRDHVEHVARRKSLPSKYSSHVSPPAAISIPTYHQIPTEGGQGPAWYAIPPGFPLNSFAQVPRYVSVPIAYVSPAGYPGTGQDSPHSQQHHIPSTMPEAQHAGPYWLNPGAAQGNHPDLTSDTDSPLSSSPSSSVHSFGSLQSYVRGQQRSSNKSQEEEEEGKKNKKKTKKAEDSDDGGRVHSKSRGESRRRSNHRKSDKKRRSKDVHRERRPTMSDSLVAVLGGIKKRL